MSEKHILNKSLNDFGSLCWPCHIFSNFFFLWNPHKQHIEHTDSYIEILPFEIFLVDNLWRSSHQRCFLKKCFVKKSKNLQENSVKDFRVTKIVKEIKFEGVWDELESKAGFQRESVTKYLRLTLVLVWNSALREKFNFYFSRIFY